MATETHAPGGDRLASVFLPAAVLLLFWWAIQWNPSASAGAVVRLAADPEESRRLVDEAKALRAAGDHEAAVETLERLNEASPGNPIHLWSLAQAYGESGRYDAEAATWEAYLDVASRPIDACPQIGLAYRRKGAMDEAIGAFERCLAYDPLNADSLFFLGHAREITQDFDAAMKLYRRGLELAPDYHDISLGIARVGLHRGDARQAVQAANRVLREIPDSTDAMLVAGMALRSQGELRKAEEILLRGVELNDRYVDFHVVLGGIAEQNSDRATAIRRYRRALELEPANRRAAERLRYLTGDPS